MAKKESLFTTELNIEAFKRLKPSATQEEINRLREVYKNPLHGHRSRGNPFLPQFIRLKGNNGEIAYIKNKSCYGKPNNIEFISGFTSQLTKKEREEWERTAFKFFKAQFISDSETVLKGQTPKKILKRPYHVFSATDGTLGPVEMYYKKYSDKNAWGTAIKKNIPGMDTVHSRAPWGTGLKATKKNEYRKKRYAWIKNKYRKHIKTISQDDAYNLIKEELKKLPLEYFGEWPDKERNTFGQWKAIDQDPRDLTINTIKRLVQTKS